MKKVILLAAILVSIFTLSCTEEEVFPIEGDGIFDKAEYKSGGGSAGHGDDIDRD